jgi:hypothetical protein
VVGFLVFGLVGDAGGNKFAASSALPVKTRKWCSTIRRMPAVIIAHGGSYREDMALENQP